MNRTTTLAAALLAAVSLTLPATEARAAVCNLDIAPSATVIAPYVEVDMAGQVPATSGRTTILAITNVTSTARYVQLNVWSATGEPVLTLTEVLSGYDAWRVDFADLLSGHWSAFDTSRATSAPPNTEPAPFKRMPFEYGPDGRSLWWDPTAPVTVPWSTGLLTPEKTFYSSPTGCQMPYGDTLGASMASTVVARLQAPLVARTHTGCDGDYPHPVYRHTADWLSTLGPNPLFFVATVDVVAACSTLSPLDPDWPGYQVAGEANVLVGDITYLDTAAGHSATIPAFHVEATDRSGLLGPYQAITGIEDHREPLPTAFALRYRTETAAQAGVERSTSLMVFKPLPEPELHADGRVNDCGGYVYYAWDEDEHTLAFCSVCCGVGLCYGNGIDPNELPLVTQLVPVTAANFDLPGPRGWIELVLPPSYGSFEDPTPGAPGAPGPSAMAAVAVRYQANYATGSAASWEQAATLGNAHCPTTARPGPRPRRRLPGR
jgi:hypothetical protein